MMQRKTDPVVTYIRDYIDAHHYPPTQREIGRACALTLSVVNRRLQMLADDGQIVYTPRMARGVALPRTSDPLPPAA